jgi:hypothetical protein
MAFAGDIGSRLKDNFSALMNQSVNSWLHHERHPEEWKPIVLFGETTNHFCVG